MTDRDIPALNWPWPRHRCGAGIPPTLKRHHLAKTIEVIEGAHPPEGRCLLQRSFVARPLLDDGDACLKDFSDGYRLVCDAFHRVQTETLLFSPTKGSS